jgi:CRP-like cAMP-binding protein
MIIQEMKDYSLFRDIKENQLKSLLDCLTATRQTYVKDEFIFMADNKAVSVGIVLTGRVYVIQEDFWGNRVILAHIEPGGLFGEAFSCAAIDKLPVSVIAAENSEVMLIDYRRIVMSCTSACVFHTQLIKNMLRILAEQNIMLLRKIECLSKRTTKEKLLSFLSSQAITSKSSIVKIPFNRQE